MGAREMLGSLSKRYFAAQARAYLPGCVPRNSRPHPPASGRRPSGATAISSTTSGSLTTIGSRWCATHRRRRRRRRWPSPSTSAPRWLGGRADAGSRRRHFPAMSSADPLVIPSSACIDQPPATSSPPSARWYGRVRRDPSYPQWRRGVDKLSTGIPRPLALSGLGASFLRHQRSNEGDDAVGSPEPVIGGGTGELGYDPAAMASGLIAIDDATDEFATCCPPSSPRSTPSAPPGTPGPTSRSLRFTRSGQSAPGLINAALQTIHDKLSATDVAYARTEQAQIEQYQAWPIPSECHRCLTRRPMRRHLR